MIPLVMSKHLLTCFAKEEEIEGLGKGLDTAWCMTVAIHRSDAGPNSEMGTALPSRLAGHKLSLRPNLQARNSGHAASQNFAVRGVVALICILKP